MRVHISHGATNFILPIPEAKLAEWTVADLMTEVSHRLEKLTHKVKSPSEEGKEDTPQQPTARVTQLSTSAGSVLCSDDLVGDVLVNDEKLLATTDHDGVHTTANEANVGNTNNAVEPVVVPQKLMPTMKGGLQGLSPLGACAPQAAVAKTFSASMTERKNEDTGETESHMMVTVLDQNLKNVINNFVNDEVMYEEQPKLDAEVLFCQLSRFKATSNQHFRDTLKPLIEFLDKHFEEVSKKIMRMLDEERMSFSTLWYLFHVGKRVWGPYDDLIVGGEIKSSKYIGGFFPGFLVTIMAIKTTGSNYITRDHTFYVPKFKGTRKLEELPVHLMTPDMEEKLKERGRIFSQISLGSHYKNYSGHMIVRSSFFINKFKADGRIMIDGQSFNRMNPNYREFRDNGVMMNMRSGWNTNKVDEDQLYMTWPTLPGFSFVAKQWGEVIVENVSEVVFDDKAFDRLVLAKEKKKLIKSLVENNHKAAFADVISGKGGGCIFLLHGKPGVGKTLTAEAIAELLRRPLYSVSVGELGTETVELETKLKEILEVASSWDAVILMDEADIFLEKRTENDIKRNAMVGIFLRLLEYHQGVLFLTTNRVRSFDGAFHSRISVALKYSDLDVSARRRIWTNLLEAASVDIALNIDKLAAYELNGRQIRTIIRLALSLAKSEGVPIGDEHIERTVSVCLQFKHDLDAMEADDDI